MELNNLIIRKATLGDKEAVFAINDNVYDGLDYLPAYYDNFMSAPNVRAYVGEIGGTVVAFSIAFLVDDGQSVISRAGRVSEKFAGRRIYATLQRHILEHSGATENWFTAVDASSAANTASFKRENELVSARNMIRFDFNVDDIKMNQVSVEFTSNIANSSTQDDIQKLMTSPKHASYLFPDDIIIVSWVPFRLRPSNIPLMGFSEMTNMCSNITENGENVNGLLSILTVYPTKNKRLTGMLDIYGNDVTSMSIHVAHQLKFVKAHEAYTRVSLLVIFHEHIDEAVVVKHFNTFGIEKFDWKWPDSGQMVSKVLAYRKLITKYWYDKTPSTDSHSQRVTAATNNLRAYIGSLYKSSNIVYDSLEPYNIFIQIKLVDILVMTTAADSPWTETIKVQGSPKYRVDPTSALPLFKTKSIQLQSTIPHDHAMIFTQYSLWQGSGGTFSGYAYTDAECLQKSLSIVEDNRDFYTAQLMAHEIGHSLGCKHDGDGNSCPKYQGYAMEASFILANKNKWTFSTCSVDYIRGYLSTLNQDHNNCLKSPQNSHPDPQMTQLISVWFGQLYTADQQCQLHFGTDSYLCRDLYYRDYSTVCLKLKCYDPVKRSCYYIDGGDGTPCGNKKWCMSDECVANNNAPSVSDSCPHGDQPGIVKNGMTCKQLVNRDPSSCRNNDVKYPCCDACNPGSSSHTTSAANQHASTPAPTSGSSSHQVSSGSIDDQCARRNGAGSYLCRGASRYDGKSYADVVCWDLQCHDPTRSNWCLSTPADDNTPCGNGKWCMNRKCVADSRAPSLSDTCPYGDQPSGTVAYGLTCDDIKHPQYHFHCYDDYIAKVCCETCQSVRRNVPSCPYGDKSDWCHANIASQRDKQTCYWGHNEDLCCESCARYKNGAHVGCEYGDKTNTCQSLSCSTYNSSQRGRCCETCLGCEYGDKTNTCQSLSCSTYSSSQRGRCCETCLGPVFVG